MIIDIWAILISMILSVVLGFIWYGPFFGKKWMALSGISMPDQKPSYKMMVTPIIISFVGAILMSSVLSYLITFYNVYYVTSGIGAGLCLALMLWVGFIVPAYLNFTGWEQKPWTLFFINSGYWLVYLFLSSIVISLFA